MSADLLRRAAKKMRERAEAATPGPWRLAEGDIVRNFDDDYGVCCGSDREAADPANVRHIASWHPLVAVAVAVVLEADAAIAGESTHLVSEDVLAVARAYLGEVEES